MSIHAFARDAGKKVGPLGGAFMMNPTTGVYGEGLGLDFLSFYALGRGGVLGDVDGSVVADAFFFFEPGLVAGTWDAAKQKMDPKVAAQHYADACAVWGREKFGDIADIGTFTKLADRVAQAHEPTPSSALYAGWREMPLPDDAAGRAAVQVALLLRELRGGAHVDAIKKVGVAPVEAVATNSPHMFQIFGWTCDMPATEGLREKCDEAEDITDATVAPAFEALDESERETFARVLGEITSIAGV